VITWRWLFVLVKRMSSFPSFKYHSAHTGQFDKNVVLSFALHILG